MVDFWDDDWERQIFVQTSLVIMNTGDVHQMSYQMTILVLILLSNCQSV